MTEFYLTPELRTVIANSKLDPKSVEKLVSNPYISHENLVTFYQTFKPTSTLIELIKTTSIHIPNKNEYNFNKPKTEEFLKSMEQLRLKAKEDEYQRLVNPKPDHRTLYEISNEEPLTPAQAHKELKNQITTIVNILISVGSVVYAVWYWTKSSWGLEDHYRILLCIFFGLLILVAEVVVYMGYLNRIEEAKIRERSKKEVKKLVKTLDSNKLE